MAEIIWTDPALADLEAIAEFIAIENITASKSIVQRVFNHVDKLERHPLIGTETPELGDSRYLQIVEPPCRIFYRKQDKPIFILHYMRHERLFRELNLGQRENREG